MQRRTSGGLSTIVTIVGAVVFSFCLSGCGSQFEAPLPDRGTLHYPVGLELHPNGRFLYVVNSNFNARFRPEAGGTVSVVDLRSLEIREQSTPFIPSFGGSIELNDDASRAYVAARQGNSLVSLRVAQGSSTSPAGGALYCLDDGQPTSNPDNCTLQEVPRTGDGADLASDPFGVSVTTMRRTDPKSGDEVPIDIVSLSYLGSNQVSTISLPNRSLSNASLQSAAVIAGGNAIARRPGTLSYYVAGRSSHVVARFSPFVNFRKQGSFAEVEALFRQGELVLNDYSNRRQGRISVDARGIGFNDSGDRLYVAARRPDALYVFDLVPADKRTGGGLAHELAASIPLSSNPSDVTLHETPDGRTLVYVPSYGDKGIDVVDPNSQTLVDHIELDASPYEMVVDTSSERCTSPGDVCRGYVSLFQDTRTRSESCGPDARQCGTVGVIDLDPASSRYHQIVRKIH